MALFEPKRIRLLEGVPDVFKSDTVLTDTEGEILIRELDKQSRQVWFVEFFLEGGVARYADVYPDQAERLKVRG